MNVVDAAATGSASDGLQLTGMGAVAIVAAALVIIGFAVGLAARLVIARVAGPPRLGMAAATLSGILGGIIGGALTAPAFGQPARDLPVLVLAGGLVGTVLVLAAAERFVRWRAPAPPSAQELISAGEGAQVEFKSTGRYNLHTKARDPRLELVISTAVAGFFNARGGTLLIGVADDGAVLGLADDYSLLRHPDADRYQLWLHDLLATTLGVTVAAQVQVDFPAVDGMEICQVRVPAAGRPVFLRVPKAHTTTFVARIGNSTRELAGQELLQYAVSRWRPATLAGPGRGRRRESRAAAAPPRPHRTQGTLP